MPAGAFEQRIGGPLTAAGIEVLQVNVGDRCNLSCRHCHVGAGPAGTRVMPRAILERCLAVLRASAIPAVDVTGGAPELHPDIRWFLRECAAPGRRVTVRSNFAVLLEEGCRDLPDLYADLRVELVTSLPSWDEEHTDRQRGAGVFRKVVTVMRQLNERGYGAPGSGLVLDVVHNPIGAYLPGCQAALERQYRESLGARQGVLFNRLRCITNMPIGRFLDFLRRTENRDEYLGTLEASFNPATLQSVMCRSMVSVGWDGTLYDCDFNQVLRLPIDHGAPASILAFDHERLRRRRITVGDHCFGCTAGPGSSCQGQAAAGR
ncbi:MAG TPA: arsenosugar biosynthesis radical SAM (seleno)protein ArsS [bacterium]